MKYTNFMEQLYDPTKDYQANFNEGPFFSNEIPIRNFPPQEQWVDFLGHKIATRIGVPAGPLLNSKWTTLAGRLGFDVVTYKTIRTQKYASHPLPNITFVDANLNSENLDDPIVATTKLSQAHFGITNSFGMPSQDPDFLRTDIQKAQKELAPGQLLIVSAVGTPRPGEDFIADFVAAVRLAKECGAQVVEANFSCPNVCTGEGSLYTNPETIADLGKKLVIELDDTPLIIKIGYFRDTQLLKKVLITAAKAGIRAISGLNSVAMKVINEHGEPALGPERPTSGVCGAPIRDMALDFIHQAREVINNEKLGLQLIGVGGITAPEHFNDFINAGADVAMTATGMMWDPYLAKKYHEAYGK
jgi:dihydroorotate dehydrogenase